MVLMAHAPLITSHHMPARVLHTSYIVVCVVSTIVQLPGVHAVQVAAHFFGFRRIRAWQGAIWSDSRQEERGRHFRGVKVQ
jgi:hypothetical protein